MNIQNKIALMLGQFYFVFNHYNDSRFEGEEIMVHQYKLNDFHIVLDVDSGAVHVVEPVVYDVIGLFEAHTPAEIEAALAPTYDKALIAEAIEAVCALRDAKMLFTVDEYADVLPAMGLRNPVVKALCLLVAHDCNLQCEYCFAEEGEYHMAGMRGLMSAETGKKALDFLVKSSGKRRNLEVDFFGGEPLMNFDVVKEIVAYGRSIEEANNKHFRFTITTNGVLLDDTKLTYINENMDNIVLSIDGRKEVNDRVRRNRGGNGTYDTIVPKFKQVAESRNQDNYYVRGTFTRYNMDFASDVLHLADLGFKQVSVEPVVGDSKLAYTFQNEDLPILFAEYERLANELQKREGTADDFNFFHFMIDLTGGPCVAKRLTGCGAGTEYLAVAADGTFYPCHQFAGLEEFKMGDVNSGMTATELSGEFERCHVYAKEECRDCWCKFYCSGGCAANAYMTNGSILKPYEIGCELQRKRTECAIMLKAANMNDDESESAEV